MLLTSEEVKHRSQRPIELVEAAFGQMKCTCIAADSAFRKDKVYMGHRVFGIGFNLKKYLGQNDKTQFGQFYRLGQLCLCELS